MKLSICSVLTLLMVGSASAQVFEITQPTSSHWWVADSANTIAWKAKDNSIPDFSVFLTCSDKTIISDKLAIISSQPNYEYSKTFNPGEMKPSAGYQLEFTDRLNSSNIYATSQSFEIKAKGSAYPSQNAPAGSSSSASLNSGSASASASSPAASGSPTSSGGRAKHLVGILTGTLVAATVALGWVIPTF